MDLELNTICQKIKLKLGDIYNGYATAPKFFGKKIEFDLVLSFRNCVFSEADLENLIEKYYTEKGIFIITSIITSREKMMIASDSIPRTVLKYTFHIVAEFVPTTNKMKFLNQL